MRLFLLLSLLLSIAYAQNATKIASLKEQLNTTRTDTARINLLNRIANAYAQGDSANAYQYSLQAISLANKLNYKIGLADAWLAQGTAQQFRNHLQQALQLFQQAGEIYLQQKKEDDYANTVDQIGKIYYLQSKYQEALNNYEKAEKLYQKRNNLAGLGTVYSNMSIAYQDKGEKDKAITYMLDALRISEQRNDKNVGVIENNLGKLFFEIRNYPEAKNYLNRSIRSCLAEGNYIDAGKAQLNMANVFITEVDYTKGIEYLDAARTSFEKGNFKRGVQACANNIGALYIRQGKYEQAIAPLQQALGIAKESKSYSGVALIEQNIGYAYTLMGKYAPALEWLNKAEETAKLGTDQYTFGEIYLHRSQLDSALGNYQSAYFYKSKYQQISDKLLNEKVARQVNELQTKYDTEKKAHQIELLSKDNSIKALLIDQQQLSLTKNALQLSEANLTITKNELDLNKQREIILQQQLDSATKAKQITELDKQNRIKALELEKQELEIARKNTILFVVVALSAMGALLAYSFHRRKQLKQAAAMQKALRKKEDLATKAVMEAEENERKRIASDLHDGVGQMMSAAKMNLSAMESELSFNDPAQKAAFDKVLALIDDSCKEVRSVSHNMMPNALLKNGLAAAVREFINQIDARVLKVNLYTEGLQEHLDKNTEAVLYRVIQECVNNVIKHAGANQLDISIIRDADGIAATIEDNGKGFDLNDANKRNGIGLKNIQTRISYLKGTVEWDAAPGRGTLIAIHVPAAA